VLVLALDLVNTVKVLDPDATVHSTEMNTQDGKLKPSVTKDSIAVRLPPAQMIATTMESVILVEPAIVTRISMATLANSKNAIMIVTTMESVMLVQASVCAKLDGMKLTTAALHYALEVVIAPTMAYAT
jgi:hypothetical protein